MFHGLNRASKSTFTHTQNVGFYECLLSKETPIFLILFCFKQDTYEFIKSDWMVGRILHSIEWKKFGTFQFFVN
jgi:hypothetical protein